MYIANKERYETMKYNRCGKSGLLLPAFSLGLWHKDTEILNRALDEIRGMRDTWKEVMNRTRSMNK